MAQSAGKFSSGFTERGAAVWPRPVSLIPGREVSGLLLLEGFGSLSSCSSLFPGVVQGPCHCHLFLGLDCEQGAILQAERQRWCGALGKRGQPPGGEPLLRI